MSQSGSVPTSPAPVARRTYRVMFSRILVLSLIGALVSVVGKESRTLWIEWSQLQRELGGVRNTVTVGYRGIQPALCFAGRPPNWFHRDGESTLLWSGWSNETHQWFRVGSADVDRTKISFPMGRDTIRAIDYPIVEKGGGTIWGKIPEQAVVVGVQLGGVNVAYPLLILSKVCVVNDEVDGKPYLITYNPFVPIERAVHVYEPLVGERRLTLGSSGYFMERKVLLYDRRTESLWAEHEGGDLRAFAGEYKGVALRPVAGPPPTTWSLWRTKHPQSRLVVGADRSRARPTL